MGKSMKSLAQRLLLNILLKIGFKPTFNYLIEILEDQALKTKNQYDDAGVRALKAIGQVETLTLQNILVAVIRQLEEEAIKTTNQYDDELIRVLRRIIEAQAYTIEQSLDIAISHLEIYVKKSSNKFDDMLPGIIQEIRKELNK